MISDRPEPVVNANLIAGGVIVLVKAILAVVVSMGWIDLSNDQQLLWTGLTVAVVDLTVVMVAAMSSRRKVTPNSDPRDMSGRKLYRYRNRVI